VNKVNSRNKKSGQGKGGGRPKIALDATQIALIEKLSPLLTTAQLADALGISRSTFFRILDKNEEVLKLYKKGQSQIVASAATNLVKQSRKGNVTASIFILKTRGGWKEDQSDAPITSDNIIEVVDATKPD
tara:strand:- start:209 stop:601 length:393 start_codon:yes stop_codon:yes gene_type:complete